MLSAIRIVLVNTSHPGNIGSAARAMKTMGLSELVLVNPKSFPHAKATELAAGADDILAQAKITPTIQEAIADCQCVIGTSVRSREIPLPLLTPRACAEKAKTEAKHHRIALVFGSEKTGLLNEELLQCHYQVTIPTNPAYGSLNLAAAVQLLCYELRLSHLSTETEAPAERPYDQLATTAEIEGVVAHLTALLIDREFLNPEKPRRLIPRIRRMLNRVRLEKMEVRILRGILTAASKPSSKVVSDD